MNYLIPTQHLTRTKYDITTPCNSLFALIAVSVDLEKSDDGIIGKDIKKIKVMG